MEYFVDFWLVAVIVSFMTLISPVLVKDMGDLKAPTWKQARFWSLNALVLIAGLTHMTLFVA